MKFFTLSALALLTVTAGCGPTNYYTVPPNASTPAARDEEMSRSALSVGTNDPMPKAPVWRAVEEIGIGVPFGWTDSRGSFLCITGRDRSQDFGFGRTKAEANARAAFVQMAVTDTETITVKDANEVNGQFTMAAASQQVTISAGALYGSRPIAYWDHTDNVTHDVVMCVPR